MTDFDNKELQGQEPQPQETPQPQEAPQTQAQPVDQPSQEAAPAEAPKSANPYGTPTPHLTFDPNDVPPFQGDPFYGQEPPRAPEPPQPEPEYSQQPQYGAPQYGAPQYGAPQYQPPQYTQPPQQTYYQPQYNVPPVGYVQKSRLAAGLLAILFGTFGIHNFYLGFTTRGVVQLLVAVIGGVFTCGIATLAIAVWGFVEGILLFIASPSRMYDGHGVILGD